MNPILFSGLLVAGLGLFSGLLLSVSSKLMAVEVDQMAEDINEILPGANCGACGYSGCMGYASALSEGKTKDTSLCSPGGNEVSLAIAKMLGLQAGDVLPTAAVVLCQGMDGIAGKKMHYAGVQSCVMATQLFGGPKDCIYGCIGFGDCVEACPYDAIHICGGIARVNPIACRACKKCVAACPKKLIEMIPLHTPTAAVLCKNKDKGNITRKECKLGCIGCMRCQKACNYDAIKVENNIAHVDYDKCVGCGDCVEVCPVDCIDIMVLGQTQQTNAAQ